MVKTWVIAWDRALDILTRYVLRGLASKRIPAACIVRNIWSDGQDAIAQHDSQWDVACLATHTVGPMVRVCVIAQLWHPGTIRDVKRFDELER